MDTSRRKYLAGVGGLGAAGFAGCTSSEGGGGDSEASVAWPEPTSEKLDDWELTTSRRRQFEPTGGVRPHARTRVYDNEALRESMREKTLGEFDRSLASFFATHIKLEGFTSMFASTSAIAGRVFEDFRAEMEDSGIENVEEVALSDPVPTHESSAELVEYRGEYETPTMSRPVTLDGAEERTLEIPSQRLAVSGIAAAWKVDANHAFAAGGAFPAEDYETTDEVSASGDGTGDGIDVRVDVDLNIPHERLRRDVVDLAESVTASDERG